MPLHDFLAHSQAHAASGKLPFGVQPLKDHEDTLVKLGSDTDAVILDEELIVAA